MEKEADQHRSFAESELLELMEQDRRRAEKEDLEFKSMIPLTQGDTPLEKASLRYTKDLCIPVPNLN